MPSDDHPPADIGRPARVCLLLVGASSWVAGGVATFVADGGVASAVLVVVGACAAALGLIGRWPEKVAISGNEVTWPGVKGVLRSQIDEARTSGDSPEVVANLEVLERRLAVLKDTGQEPVHPAVLYDREVVEAFERISPADRLVRSTPRSDSVPDFLLHTPAGTIDVETKWQPENTAAFRGRTLPVLLDALSPTDVLLVVSNTTEIGQAVSRVREKLGDRGRVVTWRGPEHDDRLRDALAELQDTKQVL